MLQIAQRHCAELLVAVEVSFDFFILLFQVQLWEQLLNIFTIRELYLLLFSVVSGLESSQKFVLLLYELFEKQLPIAVCQPLHNFVFKVSQLSIIVIPFLLD